MRVPDIVREAVGFIGYEDKRNGEIVPIGSFFFLGHDPNPGETISPKVYAVTARHVIDALRRRGVEDAILRLNPKIAGAPLITIPMPIEKWFVHPTDESIDVAATAWSSRSLPRRAAAECTQSSPAPVPSGAWK